MSIQIALNSWTVPAETTKENPLKVNQEIEMYGIQFIGAQHLGDEYLEFRIVQQEGDLIIMDWKPVKRWIEHTIEENKGKTSKPIKVVFEISNPSKKPQAIRFAWAGWKTPESEWINATRHLQNP